MLTLLAAIGAANAPIVHAATGDLCRTPEGFVQDYRGSDNVRGIQGPFPNYDGYGAFLDFQDHNLLLVNHTYLFAIVVEAAALSVDSIDVSVDDEEGDADIESYADVPVTGATFIDLPGSGVDDVDRIDNLFVPSQWNNTPGFIDDLNDDWDVHSNFPGYYNFDINQSTYLCDDFGVTDDGFSFITVTCDEAGTFEISAWQDNVTDNVVTNDYVCLNPPTTATLTATPTTVESIPAVGNISHSLLLLTLTDAAGNYTAPGWTVDWTVGGRCLIEGLAEYDYSQEVYYAWGQYSPSNPATGAQLEAYNSNHAGLTSASTSLSFNYDSSPAPGYQPKSYAAAILHCEGTTPGVASVRAELDRSPLSDVVATADVTVVGPPAFITMTAAPSKLVCGEKATILVTVTDAINQKVSDHTVVELITNFGGVIGGTGATLAFPGVNPVTPLSSGAAETFGGVATAYLLTSSAHVGPYEVVAAAGGSNLGRYGVGITLITPADTVENQVDGDHNYADYGIYARNGVFSTPVVTSQVTVTCTAGAPAVTAPNTGTGTISPPSTGDAGLAAGSTSNATLYAIVGVVAIVLAGLLSFGYARR